MTSALPPPSSEEPSPKPDPTPADDAPTELGAGIDWADPNSPLAPYYLQASHLVAVGLLGLILFFHSALVPRLWHTDLWGHLHFGRWIVEQGRLPEREPFTPYADKTAELVHFQWLTQVGFYLTYRAGEALAGDEAVRRAAGGTELLRGLLVLLIVARYAVLLAAFRRRAGSLPLACAGVVVVFALSGLQGTIQRPQLVGELCFALVLLAAAPPVLSKRALIWVPALFVFWANAHGSFVAGLVFLGACLAGQAVAAFWKSASWANWDPRRAWADPQVRRLTCVLLLSTAGIALLNPHGPALYRHVVQMARHPNIADLEEWQPMPLKLGEGGHWPFYASVLLLGVSWALSPRRWRPADCLMLAGFGTLTLLKARRVIWFIMLVPWLALPLWAGIGERLRWPGLQVTSTPSFRKTIVAVMLVLIAIIWYGPVRWLVLGRLRPMEQSVSGGTPWRVSAALTARPGWGDRRIPELSDALQAGYPDGRFSGRVFPTETQGDYLLWSLPADWPVLVYSHVHLFPPEHWRECLTVKFGRPGWREVLDRHGVNLVVIEPELHPRLAQQLRQDAQEWLVVLDETGAPSKPGKENRLLVALRRRPR